MATKKTESQIEITPEAKEEKKENKLNSRKFLVFILGSILCLAATICGFVTKNHDIVLKSLESYLVLAGLYIGGNCLTKGIYAYNDTHADNSEGIK